MNTRMLFKAGLMVLTLLAPVVHIPAAHAEAAPHDDFDSATSISALPYSTTLSTLEATTAPDDPWCYGIGATVWYTFTPATNLRIEANTFGSDYDTTLSVYTGTRGMLNQLACNDDMIGVQSRVRFNATAGETYFFMVGALNSNPGGNLALVIQEAPPLPEPVHIDLTIDRKGSIDRQLGYASVSGTVTCSRSANINVSIWMRQKVGRINVITGYGNTFITCDGQTNWSVSVSSNNPNLTFTTGAATANVSVSFYDPELETYITVSDFRDVQLAGSRK